MSEELEKIRRAVMEKAATKHASIPLKKYHWVQPLVWILVALVALFLMIWARAPR